MVELSGDISTLNMMIWYITLDIFHLIFIKIRTFMSSNSEKYESA